MAPVGRDILDILDAEGARKVIEIGHDWFDEDHTVVDELGRLVVQARQLALVPHRLPAR